MKPLISICLSLLLFPIIAEAHGPTPQKAKESLVVNAPIDRVWQTVKDFSRIAEWHPDLKESSGDGKNETGEVRNITFADGKVLEESLDSYSANDHEYQYRLKTEKPEALPVSFYTATLQLVADGDKTIVNWNSRFYRADTGNFPSEQMNDATAVKAMTQFIRNGLSGLKAKFE